MQDVYSAGPCSANSWYWSTVSWWRRRADRGPLEQRGVWGSVLWQSWFWPTRILSSCPPTCGLLCEPVAVSSWGQVKLKFGFLFLNPIMVSVWLASQPVNQLNVWCVRKVAVAVFFFRHHKINVVNLHPKKIFLLTALVHYCFLVFHYIGEYISLHLFYCSKCQTSHLNIPVLIASMTFAIFHSHSSLVGVTEFCMFLRSWVW